MSNKTCFEVPKVSFCSPKALLSGKGSLFLTHRDSTGVPRMTWNNGGGERGSTISVRAVESILSINLRSVTKTYLHPSTQKFMCNFLIHNVCPINTILVTEKSSPYLLKC